MALAIFFIETTEPENEIGVVIELKYSSDEKNLDTELPWSVTAKSRIKTMCRSCVRSMRIFPNQYTGI